MSEHLVERIYEAAFLPELWPSVLEDLAERTQSFGGVVFVAAEGCVPRWACTAATRDAFAQFVADPEAQRNVSEARLAGRNFPGFRRDVDFIPPEAFATDPVQRWLRRYELGWQVATTISIPTGDTALFCMDRRYADGPHGDDVPSHLDRFRPHLARAALIAARLGMERAHTTVATLEAVGLPAAVLATSGRVLTANALLEATPDCVAAAHGRLRLRNASADQLLNEVLALRGSRIAACSLPIAANEARPPAILHVLPLQGVTGDLFGGDMLIVLTVLREDANVPDTTLLHGLFDLTPKEARIAAALAAGRTLKEAAEAAGIRMSTARSYAEAVLRKTGAKQQSKLVALLKGTAVPTPPGC